MLRLHSPPLTGRTGLKLLLERIGNVVRAASLRAQHGSHVNRWQNGAMELG